MTGLISTIIATFSYSLRYSFIKDIKIHKISKTFLNFLYRFISLPFIILFVLISKEKLFNFGPNFVIWLTVSLTIGILLGLFQIKIFQENYFSLVESLSFTEIVFNSLIGLLILGEIMMPKQLIGISIIAVASLLIYVREIKIRSIAELFKIAAYYLVSAFTSLANKMSIKNSSPALFAFYSTIGFIIIFFVISMRKRNYVNLKINKSGKLLFLIGLFTAISFIGINYGFKALPLGVVSTILTLKTFFSLWLSHKKYQERNLGYKVAVSCLAFVGVAILFL